jgi:hypothetical protein
MRETGSTYKILVGKPEGKSHSEDLSVDGKIILELILEIWGGKLWTICIWIRIGTSVGLLLTR